VGGGGGGRGGGRRRRSDRGVEGAVVRQRGRDIGEGATNGLEGGW